jgi:hypothetical protein
MYTMTFTSLPLAAADNLITSSICLVPAHVPVDLADGIPMIFSDLDHSDDLADLSSAALAPVQWRESPPTSFVCLSCAALLIAVNINIVKSSAGVAMGSY